MRSRAIRPLAGRVLQPQAASRTVLVVTLGLACGSRGGAESGAQQCWQIAEAHRDGCCRSGYI